jgi:hypothetical protein
LVRDWVRAAVEPRLEVTACRLLMPTGGAPGPSVNCTDMDQAIVGRKWSGEHTDGGYENMNRAPVLVPC